MSEIGSGAESKTACAAAAFFDVDGTLVSTHIVHQYVFFRRELSRSNRGLLLRAGHMFRMLVFYVQCLHYLYLDRISRTRMNIVFYRNYAGLPSDRVREAAPACFERVLLRHLFADGRRCAVEHLRGGDRVVLVTGSVDFVVAPLAEYLSRQANSARVDVLARSLVERDGRFTGALDGPPIGDAEKAAALRDYARREGIDLERSHAYGDSIADLPMLESVGHPNAVNPDRGLAKAARQRGWPARMWKDVNGAA